MGGYKSAVGRDRPMCHMCGVSDLTSHVDVCRVYAVYGAHICGCAPAPPAGAADVRDETAPVRKKQERT